MKEYPPILSGDADNKAAQLRAYLVRLVQYLDERFAESEKQTSAETDAEWKTGIEKAIGTLRTTVGKQALVQHGSVSATANVVFNPAFAAAPVVFVTAGTTSDVTGSGFTLTTTGAAQWIAVGDPIRR